MKNTSLLILPLLLAACGGSTPAPTPATTPPPAAATTPAARPTIGPDQCCCPFASAEEVAFNISPKADCEAATGCVEDARCFE